MSHVVEDILASYDRVGGMNNSDAYNLPSKRAVGGICDDLLQILFPGFHDEEAIHKRSLPVLTRHRVSSVMERLAEQVQQSMRLCDGAQSRAHASSLTEFFKTLPEVRELLHTDIEAAFEGDPAAMNREEVILSYPFVEAIAIQRLAHRLHRAGVPIIPRMMTEWAHGRTGIDIHPGATIGSHFFIDHGTGVVIGETSVLGSHVKLYQGVALIGRSLSGGQSLRGTRRHPTIEDHVTIYAGTTIMGAETVIGAHSTIGANVFLTHSVPSYSLVFYEEKQLRILDKRQRHAETELEWSI
ncbi:MAG TPA: serine acetyltransferase [Terrimicrobiaceae bacterium]|nr:serine acetyltransferase [Terrimicrobiaceae bacterium]